MKKIVLAKWKANFSPERALQWCDTLLATLQPLRNVELVLAVPALCMERVAEKVQHIAGMSLAAQGVSPFPQGSYTGSLPAAWFRGLASYALIGHRERRQYFHETNQDVARQGFEALAEDLQPIVCLDAEQMQAQAAAFAQEDLEKIMWAYTPVTPASLEMARSGQEISTKALEMAKRLESRAVLYGGGVSPENALQIIQLSGISGVMLGQGCLDATAFAKMVNQL